MTDQLSFEPRDYTAIVRDLLTTLTGGTVHEIAEVPASGPLELTKLASRPFRRVSFLEGRIDSGGGHEQTVRFTEADFDLVDRDGDGLLDAIVFRPQGRTPIPGSLVTVNYYPLQLAHPVPLTDLNVGSVVRTLLETVGRELMRTGPAGMVRPPLVHSSNGHGHGEPVSGLSPLAAGRTSSPASWRSA